MKADDAGREKNLYYDQSSTSCELVRRAPQWGQTGRFALTACPQLQYLFVPTFAIFSKNFLSTFMVLPP